MKTHKQRAAELAAENFWLRARLWALTGEIVTSQPLTYCDMGTTYRAECPMGVQHVAPMASTTECRKCGGGTNNPLGPCKCAYLSKP